MSIDNNTFTHLLVVLEHDEDMEVPLARASRLCKLFSAKMTVFVSFHSAMQGKRSKDLVDDLRSIVSDHENTIKDFLSSRDASEFLDNIVLSWKQMPSLAVKALVDSKDFDLILKAPYPQSDFKKLFRSGLDQYFVGECPLPVWMVKPRIWDNDIEVLACLDICDEDIENQRLNKKILAMSERLAGVLSGQMHVVDCFYGEIGSMSIDYNRKRGFKREASIQEKHLELLKLYINEYDLGDEHVHFEEGIPDDALPQKASTLNAELTVIGNNEDSNYVARLFGDTAVSLTRAMPCDILVVKPSVPL